MKLHQAFKVLSIAALLAFATSTVMAQNEGDRPRRDRGEGEQGGPGFDRPGRGNFDPAQFQQRMLERRREQLEITDDTEWKAIEPLVTKVMDAQRQSFAGMGRGFGRGGRGGGPGGQGAEASPETEALQRAIDAKASSGDLKAAIAKYTEARKAKQAELEKAQANLRKVLTPRQEAIATLNGLL